jgi:hypothetical protein
MSLIIPSTPLLGSTSGFATIGGYPSTKTTDLNKSGQGIVGTAASTLTPNLPTWMIPIFGSIAVIMLVNVWPALYSPVVIGLIGIILLWLTQPNQ